MRKRKRTLTLIGHHSAASSARDGKAIKISLGGLVYLRDGDVGEFVVGRFFLIQNIR
jgi:hypothetical protein